MKNCIYVVPAWCQLHSLETVLSYFEELYVGKAPQTYSVSQGPKVVERIQSKAAALTALKAIQNEFSVEQDQGQVQCVLMGLHHHPKFRDGFILSRPQNRINGVLFLYGGRPLMALGLGECLGPRIQVDRRSYFESTGTWTGQGLFLAGAERSPSLDEQFGSLLSFCHDSPHSIRIHVGPSYSHLKTGSGCQYLDVTYIDRSEKEVFTQKRFDKFDSQERMIRSTGGHVYHDAQAQYWFVNHNESPLRRCPTRCSLVRFLSSQGYNTSQMRLRIAELRRYFSGPAFAAQAERESQRIKIKWIRSRPEVAERLLEFAGDPQVQTSVSRCVSTMSFNYASQRNHRIAEELAQSGPEPCHQSMVIQSRNTARLHRLNQPRGYDALNSRMVEDNVGVAEPSSRSRVAEIQQQSQALLANSTPLNSALEEVEGDLAAAGVQAI